MFLLGLPSAFPLLSFSILSAITLRTWSWRYLYLRWVSATLQQDRICLRLAKPLHNAQVASSFLFQRTRLLGVGNKSYVDFSINCILTGSTFHKSSHEIFSSVTPSHLVHAPCFAIPTALTHRSSSSPFRISFFINSLLCGLDAFDRKMSLGFPNPCLPLHTRPTTSACFNLDSKSRTTLMPFHFLPVFSLIPEYLILSSFDSLTVMQAPALITLYSSTTDFSGNCSLQVVL